MSGPQPSNNTSKATVHGTLPCGNPNRYVGRDVLRMSQGAGRGTKRKNFSPVEEDESKMTESELHLQRLLRKQINTEVSLASHFSEHRNFSEATQHCPGVEKLVGILGHNEYKQAKELDSKLDVLRHYGLDDEEISLKLQEESQAKVLTSDSGYGADPEIRKRKLADIERKIKEKEKQLIQPSSTKGALLLSRQAMEVELSHRQRYDGNVENKASSTTALIKGTMKEPSPTHPDDPINDISSIMGTLEGREKGEREARRDRRRRRKIERKMQFYKQFESVDDKDSCQESRAGYSSDGNLSDGKDSLNCGDLTDVTGEGDISHNIVSVEVKDQIDRLTVPPPDKVAAISENDQSTHQLGFDSGDDGDELEATCAARPDDWVSEKPANKKKKKKGCVSTQEVEFDEDIEEALHREEIMANKLSVNEIRQMPKFESYSEGTPSKVLYLKNLNSKTTTKNLMRLFASFHDNRKQSKMTFKLLSGRMHGQAFVSLQDTETAVEALTLVNGYKLHGSPVVISFGKKS